MSRRLETSFPLLRRRFHAGLMDRRPRPQIRGLPPRNSRPLTLATVYRAGRTDGACHSRAPQSPWRVSAAGHPCGRFRQATRVHAQDGLLPGGAGHRAVGSSRRSASGGKHGTHSPFTMNGSPHLRHFGAASHQVWRRSSSPSVIGRSRSSRLMLPDSTSSLAHPRDSASSTAALWRLRGCRSGVRLLARGRRPKEI